MTSTAPHRSRRTARLFAGLLAGAAAASVAAQEAAPFSPGALPDTEQNRAGPMPAAAAAAAFDVPSGFAVTVFAAEPAVRQPIAMTTDARGRLWVAENYTYSERTVGFHPELRDRILIFEDRDHDGRFDTRTVFCDGAQRLTSIEVGRGGVWALTPPTLVFIPDRDRNDIPDTEPKVVLDGFDHARARHNVANGLRWGPDGWLYGRHGILATSRVGAPGTPDDRRIPLDAGIWRFHPEREVFEIVATGTTNPWGMDWDAHGELFFINTVIGHLWHVVPGAHFRRMYGADPNSRIYELIDQHADHLHWAAEEDWREVRKGVTNATLAAGGGHAHAGLLIYQGGQWPAEWSGRLLTSNFHGRRFNVEKLERRGSGFVGRHVMDAFAAKDTWFRALDLIAAPDGGVFVNDWSDAGECHDNDGVHRSSGRIFKFTYGTPAPRRIADVAALPASELVHLQANENDWLARQARIVLGDRAHAGERLAEAIDALSAMIADPRPTVHRLRAMWARHVAGGSTPGNLSPLLSDADEHVRVWAIRLLLETCGADAESAAALARNHLAALAAGEESPLVRLALASALQRIPVAHRAGLARNLLRHQEDSGDHNIPLMLWYGIEPVAQTTDDSFERLLIEARIPLVQRLGARRLAEELEPAPGRIDTVLAGQIEAGSVSGLRATLDGMAAALSGRRTAKPPATWARVRRALAAETDAGLRARLRDLDALFGDGRALDQIRIVVLDTSADLAQRRAALQSLIDFRAPGLREICASLLANRDFSDLAAAGLGLSDDPAVAEYLLGAWPQLPSAAKAPVMNTLLSRREWAQPVLDAVDSGRIARSEFTPAHAARLRAFADPRIEERLDAWARRRGAPGEAGPAAAMERWRSRLSPDLLAGADRSKGRELYRALCAGCHKFHGQGGTIGPDLTGSNRDNLDYLLENILFPSATVPDAYRQTTLTMKDGRVLVGVVPSRTGRTLVLENASGPQTIDVSEIADEQLSSASLMPEGLLDAIGEQPARDLIAYLMFGSAAEQGSAEIPAGRATSRSR